MADVARRMRETGPGYYNVATFGEALDALDSTPQPEPAEEPHQRHPATILAVLAVSEAAEKAAGEVDGPARAGLMALAKVLAEEGV